MLVCFSTNSGGDRNNGRLVNCQGPFFLFPLFLSGGVWAVLRLAAQPAGRSAMSPEPARTPVFYLLIRSLALNAEWNLHSLPGRCHPQQPAENQAFPLWISSFLTLVSCPLSLLFPVDWMDLALTTNTDFSNLFFTWIFPVWTQIDRLILCWDKTGVRPARVSEVHWFSCLSR